MVPLDPKRSAFLRKVSGVPRLHYRGAEPQLSAGLNDVLKGPTLAVCASILVLGGCSNPDDPARVVASTRICSTDEVAPGVFVRLSRYLGNEFGSHEYKVISICNARGGCNPKAWYEGVGGPRIERAQDGHIRVELLGNNHRVYPDHPLTTKVDVKFVEYNAKTQALSVRYPPFRCDDRALAR